VILQRFHGVDILAAEKKGSLAEKSQGIIITKKDSGIEKIADLKGKTMIFGPTLGPTGFMSQIDLLQSNGIDPDEDLAFYTIPSGSFKHEKVAYGVLFDKYDAGALPLDDLEILDKDGRISADETDTLLQFRGQPEDR
jgi:phosphonate transport system substrate-binding protein